MTDNYSNYCLKMSFYRMNYIGIVIITLLFLSNANSTLAFDNSDLSQLLIKRVVLIDGLISETDYVKGKELYPEYAYIGLPENFLIKKEPDIIIYPKEIRLVEIKKMIFVSATMEVYTITFHFDDSIKAKIQEYTEEHLDELIALEINSEIFCIAKIIDIIEGELTVSIGNKSFDEVNFYVKKIARNIRMIVD